MTRPPPPARARARAHRRLARARRALGAALLAAGLLGCASAEPAPERAPSGLDAREEDLMLRLVEALGRAPDEDPDQLMNRLERLLPAWQSEQRKGRADALEVVLTSAVVPHYAVVAEMFRSGPHERRIVAAWALGFTRVPPNDLGIASPHLQAAALLSGTLEELPADVLANALLGLWILAEPTTPVEPLTDLLVNHHDALVRANAALALDHVLTEGDRARRAVEAVIVALDDPDPTVRVHAASIARHFPDRAYLSRLETLITDEDTPLAQARMASALGALGSRSSAHVLVPLLRGESELVAVWARDALTQIFGEDRGPAPRDWQPLLQAPAPR